MATTTTLDLINYYSNLLIIQYFDKPKARETIATSTSTIIMPQESVQEISFSILPSDGQFYLSYDGNYSDAIFWDDSAATVQAKIQAIPGLATITSTGSPLDGLITVYFAGVTPVAELLVYIPAPDFTDSLDGGDAFSAFADEFDGGDAFSVSSDIVDGGDALDEWCPLAGAVDGGFAVTTYGDEYGGGSASYEPTDFLDGGDAFASCAGLPVYVTVTETDEILPLAVQNGFNLIVGTATAVGDQLDVLGKYVGVSRTGQGFTSQITLNDADFLQLIRMAIIKNAAGSSLSIIQDFIQQFFPGEMLVFDDQLMHMSYLISDGVGSEDLIQLFVTEGLLPKPMTVQLATVIFAPVITEFFGFRTYALPAFNANPFNNYTSYQIDWPWLSYADAI